MSKKTPVTVAYGDGIGPEIMEAVIQILEAAGAPIDYEVIEIGEKKYLGGHETGIDADAWESIRRTKVFLKAPITTPQGGGYKSLNVTMRKALGLYANVRPCVSYHPFVSTKHPVMDVVIVRENEEDLYGGIEHRQTDQVYQCLKLITRPGSEKIIKYAFEYAKMNNRKKVTCFIKDNIMKLTDGLFHQIFKEISAQYPSIEADSMIIDIGTAKLAATPEVFDVIVTTNLYGDIISDVAAQITGSVGLAGSANIGDHCSMFEAIHGSAPDIAGQGIANPSGLLLGAIMLLNHIHQPQIAANVHNAWLKTIEDGIHTGDIYKDGISKQRVGTKDFALAVIERLGSIPELMPAVKYKEGELFDTSRQPVAKKAQKVLVGVDVFLHWDNGSPDDLANGINKIVIDDLKLHVMTNRGVKVWPNGFPETFCTDHWRLRFTTPEGNAVDNQKVLELLDKIDEKGYDFIKTEHLYYFDGKAGFSGAHG